MAGGTAIAIARDKEKLSNDIFDLLFYLFEYGI